MAIELSAYNEKLLERGVIAFERIADALEKLSNFQLTAERAGDLAHIFMGRPQPEPADKELAEKRREEPDPSVIVMFGDGINRKMAGQWERIGEELILAPLPHTGFIFERDLNGKWLATDTSGPS